MRSSTVADDQASESNYETDEEIEHPYLRRRLQRNRTRHSAVVAAGAILFPAKLEGLKVMRIEALYAMLG